MEIPVRQYFLSVEQKEGHAVCMAISAMKIHREYWRYTEGNWLMRTGGEMIMVNPTFAIEGLYQDFLLRSAN